LTWADGSRSILSSGADSSCGNFIHDQTLFKNSVGKIEESQPINRSKSSYDSANGENFFYLLVGDVKFITEYTFGFAF